MKDGNHRSTPRREVAFDLFCRGLSLQEVQQQQADDHGSVAPSLSTLKRWSADGGWVERRGKIQNARQEQQDQLRILYGMDYIAELTRLRQKLLSNAAKLKIHSGDQAIYALVALEKLIEKLTRNEEYTQHRKGRDPDYIELLEQIDNLFHDLTTPPPIDMSALIDEELKQNRLPGTPEPEPK